MDAGSIGSGPIRSCLRRISEATGLHVVAATGFYTQDFHPPDMDARSDDALTEEIVRDLTAGIGETGIRAGIIGEVGCSWPLHPNEARSLRAAARAQAADRGADQRPPGSRPGLAVRDPRRSSPTRVPTCAGSSWATSSGPSSTPPTLLRLARTGCYLEFDWFGETLSMYPTGPVDVPSDTERIDRIMRLIAEGHGDQVLASHDVCLKTRLARYGGGGYAPHPLERRRSGCAPRGCPTPTSTASLVANPARMLAFG